MRFNYAEALTYIHSLEKFGIKLGLERMRTLLAELGNPQEFLKFVHVAGTNGKGSTSTMISNILSESGMKVGLYLSPYVFDFCERISVLGEAIPQEELAELTEEIAVVVEKLSAKDCVITEFEFVTALAFCYFLRKKCDVVVLEVGLGGRFDATNVIASPLLSVITSIGMDHMAILGNTIAEITFEKCGIIKQNIPIVCYPQQHEDALPVIFEAASKLGAKAVKPNFTITHDVEISLQGSKFRYGNINVALNIPGEHQIYNAVTAISAVEILREIGYHIPNEAIENGLKKTNVPARQQVLSIKPTVILDGCHNYDGISELCKTLNHASGKIFTIMGILSDKDAEGTVEQIAKISHRFIAVTPDNPRALRSDLLAEIACRFCDDCYYFEDKSDALRKAFDCLTIDDTLVICGSLYLMSEMSKVYYELQKKNP